MVRGRPHERADHRFGIEEAVGIAHLHAGNTHMRRHADDADAVGRRGDRPRGVRSMTIVPCRRILVRNATDSRNTVAEVNVRGEVRVRVIQAGVEIADDHGRTAARDGVRFRRVNLPHVPLQAGKSV